ncbi:MAG: hypothetical protein ACOY4K_06420 [Pseudomonadota bacterium]
MADAPKARAPRKRAAPKAVPAVEQTPPAPEPEAVAPAFVTLDQVKERRTQLLSELEIIRARRDEARSVIVEADNKGRTYEGALLLCDELIAQMEPPAPPAA